MTDRFHSLTVVLEKDMRSDDAQALISAITQLRGILSVSGNIANLSDYIAQDRARNDLGVKLWNVLYPNKEQA
jgi:hypothetical protein